MIYVAHDQEEALAFADRVVAMSNRLIQQIVTSEDLYARPANGFVAGCVGEPPIDVMKCRMHPCDPGRAVDIEGHEPPLPPDLHTVAAGLGPDVLAAVRPNLGDGPLILSSIALQSHRGHRVISGRARAVTRAAQPPGPSTAAGTTTISASPAQPQFRANRHSMKWGKAA